MDISLKREKRREKIAQASAGSGRARSTVPLSKRNVVRDEHSDGNHRNYQNVDEKQRNRSYSDLENDSQYKNKDSSSQRHVHSSVDQRGSVYQNIAGQGRAYQSSVDYSRVHQNSVSHGQSQQSTQSSLPEYVRRESPSRHAQSHERNARVVEGPRDDSVDTGVRPVRRLVDKKPEAFTNHVRVLLNLFFLTKYF